MYDTDATERYMIKKNIVTNEVWKWEIRNEKNVPSTKIYWYKLYRLIKVEGVMNTYDYETCTSVSTYVYVIRIYLSKK